MHLNIKRITRAALIFGAFFIATSVLAESRDALVSRGAVMIGFGGCQDCHTPSKMGPNGPEKDIARGLSGHPEGLTMPPSPKLDAAWNWAGSATMTAFSGPWGQSYAANLTPDRETGIGTWSERDFVRAMRTGKHLGVARPIMPPMPWENLARLSDRDLRAVFAYLMSRPAVKNRVPEYMPPSAASTNTKVAGGSLR